MKLFNSLLWFLAFLTLVWFFYAGLSYIFRPLTVYLDPALEENIRLYVERKGYPNVIREVAKPCPTTTKEFVEVYYEEPEIRYVADNTCPMKLTACNQGMERLKAEKEQCQTELADEKGAFLLLLNKCQ